MSKKERRRKKRSCVRLGKSWAWICEQWNFFRRYVCTEGDAYPNIKYLYWAKIDKIAEELTLYEGQRLLGITPEQRSALKFANILGQVLEDFIAAKLWPQPVDNF